jgi:hypothetical protein
LLVVLTCSDWQNGHARVVIAMSDFVIVAPAKSARRGICCHKSPFATDADERVTVVENPLGA